jgi:hypothetical protein
LNGHAVISKVLLLTRSGVWLLRLSLGYPFRLDQDSFTVWIEAYDEFNILAEVHQALSKSKRRYNSEIKVYQRQEDSKTLAAP